VKRTTVALLTLLVSVLTWDASAAAGPAPSAISPAPALTPPAVAEPPAEAAPTPPAAAPAPPAPSAPWLRPAAPAKANQAPAAAPTGSGFSFGKFAALLLVVGLGGYALYTKKKRAAQNPLKGSGGLRVVESARLGPKASLVTAVVGRRVILLGVTDQSVTKLGWLSPGAEEEGDDALADGDDELGSERASSALPAAVPARPVLAREAAPRAKTRPSDGSFASKLRSALGTTAPSTTDDALATSAQLTRDVVDVGRGRRRARPTTTKTREQADEAMIDVEAQAAGLIRRLKGKSQ